MAACFNNWEREGNFSEVLSLAFSHYREREREWRKRHGSTTIRNFQFHMNNSTKNTSQVNPYIVSKKKKSIYICNIKTPCKLLDHSSSRLFSSSYSSQAITFFSHSCSSDSIITFPLSPSCSCRPPLLTASTYFEAWSYYSKCTLTSLLCCYYYYYYYLLFSFISWLN